MERAKEESAVILDFLPHGYVYDNKPLHMRTPIAQAIGRKFFVLLELAPKKDVHLQPHDDVYIGDGKRDKIHHIIGKLPISKLTATAKHELDAMLKELVLQNEKRFVDFFNTARPLSTRMHQLELLPGLGKKHMWEIIEVREDKPFESFADIRQRVKLMPDPEKAIIRRILLEMEGNEKHRLFVEM